MTRQVGEVSASETGGFTRKAVKPFKITKQAVTASELHVITTRRANAQTTHIQILEKSQYVTVNTDDQTGGRGLNKKQVGSLGLGRLSNCFK